MASAAWWLVAGAGAAVALGLLAGSALGDPLPAAPPPPGGPDASPPAGTRSTPSNRDPIGAAAAAAAADAARVAQRSEAESSRSAQAAQQSGGYKAYKTVGNALPFGAVLVQLSDLAWGIVKGPKIGPIPDPLAEAEARLPAAIRGWLLGAAAKLPPSPNEDTIQPAVNRPWIRLTLAAKRKGVWPPQPNQSEDGTVIGSVLEAQLRAWAQVAQEVDPR